MWFDIASLLLDVSCGLVGGGCLLRWYMQWQRVPFANPLGRLVFALTNWIVLPARRLLPSMAGWDTASLASAWAMQLVQFSLLWLLRDMAAPYMAVIVLASFGVLRLAISGLSGLIIAYAVLSWVQTHSPMSSVMDRLCSPLLRPLRRAIPLVGGVDLSPLVLLVAMQVLALVVAELQRSALAML